MRIERWNPSVKAATILICVILLSLQYLISLNLAVFFACLAALLFFSDATPKRIFTILTPAFFAALTLFFMGLYYARDGGGEVPTEALEHVPYAVRAAMSTNLTTALQLSTRLLAFAGLGILFALTTDGVFFVSSLMHQCRLSPKFAYGTLAAIHLMPDMLREYRQVQRAFRARGMKVRAFSTKVLFAMLVNSIRWSESAAMAMESKGFSGDAPRTYYSVPRVQWGDWVASAVCIGGIALGMAVLG